MIAAFEDCVRKLGVQRTWRLFEKDLLQYSTEFCLIDWKMEAILINTTIAIWAGTHSLAPIGKHVGRTREAELAFHAIVPAITAYHKSQDLVEVGSRKVWCIGLEGLAQQIGVARQGEHHSVLPDSTRRVVLAAQKTSDFLKQGEDKSRQVLALDHHTVLRVETIIGAFRCCHKNVAPCRQVNTDLTAKEIGIERFVGCRKIAV